MTIRWPLDFLKFLVKKEKNLKMFFVEEIRQLPNFHVLFGRGKSCNCLILLSVQATIVKENLAAT
jgi:hypothetical protein